MKTEKQLQDYLRKRARDEGIGFDKLESKSRAGFPDTMIYRGGRVVFAELKSEKGTGRLSPGQERVIADLRSHGLAVWVIDSVGQVEELIDHMLT